jgi:predicted RNA binding protein YcfA (HicA-like mRNA interferase family)
VSGLPTVNFRRMDAVLINLGFASRQGKGSHVFYRHADGRTTTVPNHPGDLPRPLVRKILRDINLTPDEFQKELNKL